MPSSAKPIRIGVVGLGKIARDQHLPVIAASTNFEIAFLADRAVESDINAPHFTSLDSALESGISCDAVALCTSPQPRFELCERLFDFDCAILLEKPAAATFAQAETILANAQRSGNLVFAAWHSKFSPQIEMARQWMASRDLIHGRVEWRENAKKWHPGQDWLWRDGGFGVFDPGMNALSILSEIVPNRLQVENGQLFIPENAETPAKANFQLSTGSAEIDVAFEFLASDSEKWDIFLEATDGSRMMLSRGGASIAIDSRPTVHDTPKEYESVYAHFANLIQQHKTDFDIEPLRITDQIFQVAAREHCGAIEI